MNHNGCVNVLHTERCVTGWWVNHYD